MTATPIVGTAAASRRFTEHSLGVDYSSRSGDWKMNTPSTTPSTPTASRRQPDGSDRAQAQVFAAMLTAEIETVSALVDEAEQFSHNARRVGQGKARLWHEEEARSQRRMLYELHRQLDALTRRFPDLPGWINGTDRNDSVLTVDRTPSQSGSLRS
ncbi:hypothetical protein QM797_05560 [Rhodococcus sp. IEGM 1381]|uniref:hypothetical protein n=1 Tax=Rhodococcus sp. IEGM 1381 TaxID=3047085 RepID=UPI0024B6F363|nr:hypothetical protein [Rhodococcus sp. IEGM 1381]MDI9894186.1 hypothetical protein [Rhodococcus sp. IEGM 1381]